MDEVTIRLARVEDREAIVACVNAAYVKYIERMEKKPAPMLADYAALIAEGAVYVISADDGVHGIVVLLPRTDYLFLENVAVYPREQGRGLGHALMGFVERQARAANLCEIRLYTHERMTENLAYYHKLGYEEVERRVEDGYSRVFMRKMLL
ncbi:MAG: GNAT family N-acetyltransferase [Thermomicrobiales bacterium]